MTVLLGQQDRTRNSCATHIGSDVKKKYQILWVGQTRTSNVSPTDETDEMDETGECNGKLCILLFQFREESASVSLMKGA